MDSYGRHSQRSAMEDVPQPASEPYAVGERVQIYLGPDDPDASHHGTVCAVLDVLVDDLGTETERPMDAYSYTLRDVDTDERLPVPFRHRDLVPVTDTQ